jgi:hypothetical protein
MYALFVVIGMPSDNTAALSQIPFCTANSSYDCLPAETCNSSNVEDVAMNLRLA